MRQLRSLIQGQDSGQLDDCGGPELKRHGGPARAALRMSMDTGTIIGPIVAGVLIDRGSYPLAFGFTGAVTLLAMLPWLRARETLPHRTQYCPTRPGRCWR